MIEIIYYFKNECTILYQYNEYENNQTKINILSI
jgi:hypothetical protein